nr:MAG TPA: hypothetical protein [Caudoviricetes sp.]
MAELKPFAKLTMLRSRIFARIAARRWTEEIVDV